MRNLSPKIVLVTSITSFKPRRQLCWHPWIGQASRFPELAHAPDGADTGADKARCTWAWSQVRRNAGGGRSRNDAPVTVSVPKNPCLMAAKLPHPLRPPLMSPTRMHTFPTLGSAHAIPSLELFFAPPSTLYMAGPVLSAVPLLSHFVLMRSSDRYTRISQDSKPQPSDNER